MVTKQNPPPEDLDVMEAHLNGLSPSGPPETTDPNGEVPVADPGWFASLDTRRIDLGGGRWIEIKDELTYREESSLTSAGIKARPSADNPTQQDFYIDTGEYDLAKIKVWVVDWNAKDRQGYAITYDPSAVDDLRPAQAREILDAIAVHQKALEARKNSSGTGTRS